MPDFRRIDFHKFEIGEWYVLRFSSSYQIAKRIAQVFFSAVPDKVDPTPVRSADSSYDWAIKIRRDLSQDDRDKLNGVVRLLQGCIHIDDPLTLSYALSTQYDGSGSRTEVGALVYRAKDYGNWFRKGDPATGLILAERLTDFISHHPILAQVDLITYPPGSNPSKRYDLPQLMVEDISGKVSVPILQAEKVRATKPLKNCDTQEEKEQLIKGAYRFPVSLTGKRILIVDDLYDAGTTCAELARTATLTGASAVYGLCCTKTSRR